MFLVIQLVIVILLLLLFLSDYEDVLVDVGQVGEPTLAGYPAPRCGLLK